MYTRGAIAYDVYQRLNKSAATPGFFTEAKVNNAIQEAIDYVGTKMMLADQGFLKAIGYLDVEANQITIAIPSHMEMIEEVRYLVGNVYIPLAYDSGFKTPMWSVNSGATSIPCTYRIVDNKFFFNPPLGVGGTAYLQVEYQRMPSIMRNSAQQVDPQFSRCFIHYIVYRTCSILAAAMGQTSKPWAGQEADWYEQMQTMIERRNKQSIAIGNFEGF